MGQFGQRSRPLHSDPRDALIADLRAQVESLSETVRAFSQRLTALENAGGGRSVKPFGSDPHPRRAYDQDTDNGLYDRKNARVELQEDSWGNPPHTPDYGARSEPAQPAGGSWQLFATQLGELFNRANRSDFDTLAADFGAESYTNERKGDLATLIKSDIDRFWVVPIPGNPDMGVMIPGFSIKKGWVKLRQPDADHPLAYHFELRRGDRLQVIEPAILRRNASGFWELKRKGEVVGIT